MRAPSDHDSPARVGNYESELFRSRSRRESLSINRSGVLTAYALLFLVEGTSHRWQREPSTGTAGLGDRQGIGGRGVFTQWPEIGPRSDNPLPRIRKRSMKLRLFCSFLLVAAGKQPLFMAASQGQVQTPGDNHRLPPLLSSRKVDRGGCEVSPRGIGPREAGDRTLRVVTPRQESRKLAQRNRHEAILEVDGAGHLSLPKRKDTTDGAALAGQATRQVLRVDELSRTIEAAEHPGDRMRAEMEAGTRVDQHVIGSVTVRSIDFRRLAHRAPFCHPQGVA